MASQVDGGLSLYVQLLFSIDEPWLVGEKFLPFHRRPLCRPSVVDREPLGEEVLSPLQRQLKDGQNSTTAEPNKKQTNAIDQHRKFSSSGGQFRIWLLLLFVCHNLTHVCCSANERMRVDKQARKKIEHTNKTGMETCCKVSAAW